MKNIPRACAALGAALALAALAACDRQPHGAASATPSPSEQTVDVQAAPPTGDPPGTTPVDGKQSDVSKSDQSTKMPQEGDDHSHSSVAPKQPQKADGVDPIQATPERTQ
jgi:hypothetical protein